MIKILTRLVMLSAVGVLFLPGNEPHREQVVRGLTAAYANAGNYCNRNRDTCDRVLAQFKRTGALVAQEASMLADTVATSRAAVRSDDYRRPF